MKENEWLTPKTGITMKHACEMQGMKGKNNASNNKHKEVSCDEEKDADE